MKDAQNKEISLYPYNTMEISVIFVYGIDQEREKYRILLTGLGTTTLSIFVVLVLMAAAVLCFYRRTNRLQRDGYISSFIDVCITFYGGGNLHMRHTFERLFLGMLLIGFFFLMAFWQEAVLFPSFLLHDQRVRTFNDLIKKNPPIYSAGSMSEITEIIEEMLRFVEKHYSNY